jgi:Kef-type K+ transport system membrane component KefB
MLSTPFSALASYTFSDNPSYISNLLISTILSFYLFIFKYFTFSLQNTFLSLSTSPSSSSHFYLFYMSKGKMENKLGQME